MCLFECYTLGEDINHKTGFVRSQPQGYKKLLNNLKSSGNLIPKSNIESNIVPRQTTQISTPPQRVNYSLKYVILHGVENEELGYGRTASF